MNDIDDVINKIVETTHPKYIYLFGSYAYGTPREDSDLDLCIIKESITDKQTELAKIRRELFNVPYAMDLILMSEEEYDTRKDIWWTIQGQVAEKGKQVYAR